MTESKGADNTSIQLNVKALIASLTQHPIPDTFALDFLFEGQWRQISPQGNTIWIFNKKGVLQAIENDTSETHQAWSIAKTTKILTLEKNDESLSFEIEFVRYQIRYVSEDWLILHDLHDQSLFFIFYNTESFENKPSLNELKKELETGHSSDQPNYYLILIFIIGLIIIFILMVSI